MPWKETDAMEERIRFINRYLDGERMTDLCREFMISRKTGYKFYARYLAEGIRGMAEGSRKPQYHPHHTPKAIEELILKLRHVKPTWGPKKLRAKLMELHPGLTIPASSTVGDVLKRYGVPLQKRGRKRHAYPSTSLSQSTHPNDIWCVDFKGQFRLGNGKYCYPLTVSDHYSRYVVGCDSLEHTRGNGVMNAFESFFKENGLPSVILSDNGSPFASCGLMGWSKLSVWWLRLGIRLERIEPGHPEQNGRHERMHWTLKNETTRPASSNHLSQQERFDHFRHEFNQYRPHEALDMKSPGHLYSKSKKVYPITLEDPDYPCHDIQTRVKINGQVTLYKDHHFHLSSALTGEMVGFREISPQKWLVSFMDYNLGIYLERQRTFFENINMTGGSGVATPLPPVEHTQSTMRDLEP